MIQNLSWRKPTAVADPREGPRPPLFSDETLERTRRYKRQNRPTCGGGGGGGGDLGELTFSSMRHQEVLVIHGKNK